jgi:hypothetical protein
LGLPVSLMCMGVYSCKKVLTHVLRKMKASSTNWLIWIISWKPCLANILSRICQIRDRDTLKNAFWRKVFFLNDVCFWSNSSYKWSKKCYGVFAWSGTLFHKNESNWNKLNKYFLRNRWYEFYIGKTKWLLQTRAREHQTHTC